MKMISESLDNPPEQPAQFRGPVTALAFAQLENQRIILFGEGTHLQVRSANEGRVLARAVAFKTQVIHGISLSEAAADGKIPLIVWGGYVFRCAWLQSSDWSISFYDKQTWTMPGWILDVRFGPPQDRNTRGDKELRAAMVTAQDSLLLVPFPPPAGWPHHYRDDEGSATGSVLYSAHLRWMSNRHVVLATGTAFGDIAVRSFRLNQDDQGFTACSHRVFRGHEGSIFGVQTSDRLPPLGRGGPTMLLASCSDDRTIRVWDISEFSTTIATPLHLGKPAATASTGTGFGGEQSSAPDGDLEKPLAMAWGHLSRIWGTRFLTAFPRADLETSGVDLLSFGEDATMQHWRFSGRSRDSTLRTLGHDITFTLERQRTTSLHAGKNVWSIACSDLHKGRNTVAIGGADGKIACISLGEEEPTTGLNADMDSELPARYGTLQKYSLVSSNQLLAITGEGSVLLALLQPLSSPSQATTGCSDEPRQSLEWKEVAQINCPKPHVLIRPCREAGVTFFVTGEGAFYSLILETKVLQFLFSAATRPTNMLCQKSSGKKSSDDSVTAAESQLEFIHVIISYDRVPVLHYWRLKISKDGRSIDHVPVQLIKPPADFLPTSMAMTVHDILLLGTRDGYVRACKLMQDRGRNYDDTIQLPVVLWSGSLDAVTSIICLSTDEQDQACIILTTTRDGKYAVYRICFKNVESESPPEFESLTLHAATSTVLSIIEGAYLANHQLILYGFRSTEFVVWNDTSQQMIMTVDCGGAHRNWDFCPLPGHASGGSLIWRKGPRLYRRTQSHTNHHIIQEGLHGREIKALAVSPPLEMEPGRREQLIATGAEDTSIRLLAVQESSGLEVKDRGRIFKCHAIMKKHTTGIQALRWSPCGRYLFSSGGYEEFFVWRVRPIPGFGIGVVQEAICPVLDEMPVVRITSFDVSQISNDQSADSVAPNTPVPSSFLISLSRSDSSIRVRSAFELLRSMLICNRHLCMTVRLGVSAWFMSVFTRPAA